MDFVDEYETERGPGCTDWKKLYSMMLTAADKAIDCIESADPYRAARILQEAMYACEEEYIGPD